MNDWNNKKNLFRKTVEKLIEMKYITVNEVVSLDGVASMFANDLSSYESEIKKLEETKLMINLMNKYIPPEKIKEFFDK